MIVGSELNRGHAGIAEDLADVLAVRRSPPRGSRAPQSAQVDDAPDALASGRLGEGSRAVAVLLLRPSA